ncbi:MAG TPA: hypothetical protein VF747_00995 [Blastocatellia bacterium]|jgi:hypothetical protein
MSQVYCINHKSQMIVTRLFGRLVAWCYFCKWLGFEDETAKILPSVNPGEELD